MFNQGTFSERLRALRMMRNIPRTQVAQLLQVTKTQVCDMENGKTATTLNRLCILAEYYGVSADYLLGLTDDPTPSRER